MTPSTSSPSTSSPSTPPPLSSQPVFKFDSSLRPSTQTLTITPTIQRITVISRIINTNLTRYIALESCKPTTQLLSNADTQLVTSGTARTRFEWIGNADLARRTVEHLACTTAATDLVGGGSLAGSNGRRKGHGSDGYGKRDGCGRDGQEGGARVRWTDLTYLLVRCHHCKSENIIHTWRRGFLPPHSS